MYRSASRIILLAAALLLSPLLISVPAGAETESGIKNVIFIILDALRADHLGVYGYHRNTSPSLDRLGRQGVVFDRAIVQAGWTKSSIPSYFTSTYPSIHGVLELDDLFPKNLTTMAEIFQHNGYYTIGLVNNIHITEDFKFNRGFNVYHKTVDDLILSRLRSFLINGYDRELKFQDIIEERAEILTGFLKRAGNTNMVNNSGFENGCEDWNCQSNWLTSLEAYSGDCAVHIDKNIFSADNFWHLNQRVTLDYGCDYLIGAFIKTKNLRVKSGVGIYEINNRKHPYTMIDYSQGDSEWELILGIFHPGYSDDNGESEVVIRPGRLRDFQGGEFWIDDVFVIPLHALPQKDFFRPAEKMFFYAHLIDPHAPYMPSLPYLDLFCPADKIRPMDKYDGEIRLLDDKLGLLFETLASRDILDKTLIVITSDHGEAFGEHHWIKHSPYFFYDETVRVPLIFYNPILFPSPQRVEETVQASVDLLPSLIKLLGLKVPPEVKFQGRSYFPLGSDRSPYAFFYQGPYLKMVTTDKWKYVSDEYYSFIDGLEIRGKNNRDSQAEITIIAPTHENTAVFNSEEEFQKSDFLHSCSPEVQKELEIIYKVVSQNQEIFSVREKAMLFNLKDDPEEKINLLECFPAKARELQKIIRKKIIADRIFQDKSAVVSGGKKKLTNQIKEEMRAIGYMN